MRSLKFDKVEESRANNVYIRVNYAGGDADTEHPEEWKFKDIKFSEINNHIEEITAEVEKYKTLKELLEDHDVKCNGDYDQIKEEYGEELAKLYDNTPNDPQGDYQFKCYIDDIMIIGYDEQGAKYQSYT